MKTLIIGLIFGLFGAVAVSVSFAAQWPTWVIFIAWVSYYIFGKSLNGALLSGAQILLGILLGVLIQLTGTFLGEFVGTIGLPIAVFFYIGSLAFVMKLKPINNIPAWFMGLIIFFGTHPVIALVPLAELLLPILAGFIFAWLNDSAVQKVAAPVTHS